MPATAAAATTGVNTAPVTTTTCRPTRRDVRTTNVADLTPLRNPTYAGLPAVAAGSAQEMTRETQSGATCATAASKRKNSVGCLATGPAQSRQEAAYVRRHARGCRGSRCWESSSRLRSGARRVRDCSAQPNDRSHHVSPRLVTPRRSPATYDRTWHSSARRVGGRSDVDCISHAGHRHSSSQSPGSR